MGTNNLKPMFLRASLALLAAPLLAACSSDSNEDKGANDERVALKVTSGITRVVGDTWTAGDCIGIYSMSNGAVADGYANKQYTTEAGGETGTFAPATADQTVYFPMDGSTRDLIAYYPYSATKVANGIYTVDVSDQSDQAALDLMTSALVQGKSKTESSVQFAFRHKLTQISITVQAGGGITDDDLEGMTVAITGQKIGGTCNLTTDGSSVVGDVTTAVQVITLKTSADGKSVEGILLPATSTAGMALQFNINGLENPLTWKISNASQSQSFAEGKKYVYNVTVKRQGISENDVTATITDWTLGNGEQGESGQAE